MKPYQSLSAWVGIFVLGFFTGIIFSAWKLDTNFSQPSSRAEMHEHNLQAELRNRIANLEKMLSMRPNDPQVLIQLGNDYFDIGDHQKAVETYRRALEIDPRNPDVFTDMAISYRKLGKTQESVAAFRKALDIDPNHNLALFNLGIVLRDDLKDYTGALNVWETFLRVAPDSPHTVMIRPWVKQLKDKLGQAQTQSEPGKN